MKLLLKIIPWFFLALFGTEVAVVMLPRKDGEWRTREFGRLPVLLNGRIQPMDSIARNALLQIRSTGDVPLEEVPSWKFWHHPKKLKSTEWLLEVFFKPDAADTRPIFLIHHPDLLSELKLDQKGISKSGLRYYTFNELKPVLDEIIRQGRKASDVNDAARTTYQKQVLKLANAVFLYQQLKNTIQPEGTRDYARLIENYRTLLPTAIAAFRAQQNREQGDDPALKSIGPIVQEFDNMANNAYALAVPPDGTGDDHDNWISVGTSLLGAIRDSQIHPAINFFARMGDAYQAGDAAAFNQAVSEYRSWLEPKFPKETLKGRAEFYFNEVKAFLHATIIYVCAFLLACCALLASPYAPNLAETLRKSAVWLIALAFVVHTFGLVFRMVLEGRPPVTNLYSSAIFIGWGACLLGLVLERFYKIGLGCAVAGLAGFVTLLIAHNLALGGDTMEMLRAVLDTNFWLATHVTTVTIGYASTFVAGLLGIAYVLNGVVNSLLDRFFPALAAKNKTAKAPGEKIELNKALAKMIYAIVCFATLFSFVGTVLGGIWADQSWGRFWGWDPKENGALIIVLWNALILHARWGGMVRERGLALMSIFGNVVTSFSWFGVNMLGIGLHSYGFMDEAFKWLMLFMASQLVLIGVGLLPLKFSASTSAEPAKPASRLPGRTKPAAA